MAKMNDLMSRLGGNVAESMGATRQASRGPDGPAKPDPSDGTERLRSAALIDLDRIVPDPDQPRKEFDPDAIDRLAASLSEHGQLQPIAVRWSEGMGKYVIVAGERRWRATMRAGRTAIDAVIVDAARGESQILEMQLIENCLREDLKPIEQARAFRTLMDRNGWSGDQLARTLHLSDATIFRALALLNLPEAVQERVEQGELAPSVAYEVSKLQDPAAQAEVAARVVAEGLNRAETVEAVRQVEGRARRAGGSKSKGRAAIKARPVTSRTFKAEGGYRITVERGRGIEPAALLAAAREVVARLEAEAEAEGQGAEEWGGLHRAGWRKA